MCVGRGVAAQLATRTDKPIETENYPTGNNDVLHHEKNLLISKSSLLSPAICSYASIVTPFSKKRMRHRKLNEFDHSKGSRQTTKTPVGATSSGNKNPPFAGGSALSQ